MWSSSHQLERFVTERARDAIDLCNELWLARSKSQLPGSCSVSASTPPQNRLIIDLSQDASRSPWAERMRSRDKNSDFYSYQADRTVLGIEHWMCLGFPTEKLNVQGLTQHELKDVSGEAMACPCVGLTASHSWRATHIHYSPQSHPVRHLATELSISSLSRRSCCTPHRQRPSCG